MAIASTFFLVSANAFPSRLTELHKQTTPASVSQSDPLTARRIGQVRIGAHNNTLKPRQLDETRKCQTQ